LGALGAQRPAPGHHGAAKKGHGNPVTLPVFIGNDNSDFIAPEHRVQLLERRQPSSLYYLMPFCFFHNLK